MSVGLSIICPFCGGRASIRDSNRVGLLAYQALVKCHNCGTLKADFVGQLTNVRRAVYIDCPESKSWDKPENEWLKEKGIRKLTNEERIKQLKGEELPFDLKAS